MKEMIHATSVCFEVFFFSSNYSRLRCISDSRMISDGRHTERALAIPKCENINSVHITAQLFRGGSLPWFGTIRTTLVPSVRRCKTDQVSALGIIVVDYMMLTPTTKRTSPLHPQQFAYKLDWMTNSQEELEHPFDVRSGRTDFPKCSQVRSESTSMAIQGDSPKPQAIVPPRLVFPTKI